MAMAWFCGELTVFVLIGITVLLYYPTVPQLKFPQQVSAKLLWDFTLGDAMYPNKISRYSLQLGQSSIYYSHLFAKLTLSVYFYFIRL